MKSALAILFAAVTAASGATVTLPAIGWQDVSNAINSASAGDTLILPVGRTNWPTTVVWSNKPLTIIGQGMGLTIITNSQAGGFPVETRETLKIYANTNGICRLSAIGFDGNSVVGNNILTVDYVPGHVYALGRVDHCRFSNTSTHNCVTWTGLFAGLMDHCEFINDDICFTTYAKGPVETTSWTLNLTIGTTNCVVIEDCLCSNQIAFIGGPTPSDWTERGRGTRDCVRHCTFVNTFASSTFDPCFDAHGNNGWPGGGRGTRQTELYFNSYLSTSTSGYLNPTAFRGGTILMWSNNYTGAKFLNRIYVREEDGEGGSPLLTTYPGYDQHWLWIWGNTMNASTFSNVWYNSATDPIFVKATTNLWWTPPTVTNGPVYGTLPTSDATMWILTNYAPLAYPHPLINRIPASLARVRNLRAGTVHFQ